MAASETGFGVIALETNGPVARIVIDNPGPMNAVNAAMWRALPVRIAEAEANQDVRVIMLTGRGDKAFSSGADISEFDTARTGAASAGYDDLNTAAFDALLNCAKPTIAAIRGFCLGGGFEIALCCDMRLAAEGAEFGIPAARLGLGYNARWIRLLLACMSAASAKELLFTGGRFGCVAALRMGFVNRVFPAAAFEAETTDLAAQIAANAPLTIRAAKAAIDAFATGQAPDYAHLDAMVDACFQSADYAEGRAAFAQKRKPVFEGC
ncbi:MAG: enoyl-CoA hydratase [Hyphomicrobiales bacterium]|nr:enoyl-CoA hydratase [Hyphomicrobiales bacterium]